MFQEIFTARTDYLRTVNLPAVPGKDSVLVPMGNMGGKFFTLPTRSVLANTVMAAYQRPYALNFEVWRPQGMPAGWYATFDGFAVAQVAPNRWVYGRTSVIPA